MRSPGFEPGSPASLPFRQQDLPTHLSVSEEVASKQIYVNWLEWKAGALTSSLTALSLSLSFFLSYPHLSFRLVLFLDVKAYPFV